MQAQRAKPSTATENRACRREAPNLPRLQNARQARDKQAVVQSGASRHPASPESPASPEHAAVGPIGPIGHIGRRLTPLCTTAHPSLRRGAPVSLVPPRSSRSPVGHVHRTCRRCRCSLHLPGCGAAPHIPISQSANQPISGAATPPLRSHRRQGRRPGLQPLWLLQASKPPNF